MVHEKAMPGSLHAPRLRSSSRWPVEGGATYRETNLRADRAGGIEASGWRAALQQGNADVGRADRGPSSRSAHSSRGIHRAIDVACPADRPPAAQGFEEEVPESLLSRFGRAKTRRQAV